ncbi:MAG: 8-oxoguanine DNA glycosylase, partial [Gemmatimonadetes bacterium]|nr:8-oxoguanine DNA glycosylase [Gemmatimonadota bacterium]
MTSPALLPAPCIDLAATLDGGQAFCWWEDGGGYRGVLGRRVLRLSAGEGGVEVEALDGGDVSPLLSGLRDYLGLDDDLDALRGRHADDPPVMEAMQHCPGLRLLRQDPWECLVGFICSANSSVRKIKADVAAIARAYGDRLPPGKDEHDYAFPSPEQLARADETDLRGLRLGFRAPCVAAAA